MSSWCLLQVFVATLCFPQTLMALQLPSVLLARDVFLKYATAAAFLTPSIPTSLTSSSSIVSASANSVTNEMERDAQETTTTSMPFKVAYRSTTIPLSLIDQSNSEKVNVQVPVAIWYPSPSSDASSSSSTSTRSDISSTNVVRYKHRISVAKIGTLLAGWNLPQFLKRDFSLTPMLFSEEDGDATTRGSIVDGTTIPLPISGPVVVLAHGYLGSMFDLSHLAESLASRGILCLSPEYPESLAASYQKVPGLDRSIITSQLLQSLSADWNVQGTKFGIVGHSLGCGTAMTSGDKSWTRVCIAGFPGERDEKTAGGNVLILSSVNDGAVSIQRIESAIPRDFVRWSEDDTTTVIKGGKVEMIPRRTALIFEHRETAPNHISYLAENVNEAMMSFLSPLLPVANALSIPVLDFDKYQQSRDSKRTAKIVIPLVREYLVQEML